MQHGHDYRPRVVAMSSLYQPRYDSSVLSGPDGTLGPQYPVDLVPGQEYDPRDPQGVTELFRLVLQGFVDRQTPIGEVEAKLVHIFGVVALEDRNSALGEGEPLLRGAPLSTNIKFWQHVSVFRDEPATLEILRHLAGSIFSDVGVSAGTDTPLHTALWAECGVEIVRFLLEYQPQWLLVTDQNGLRPLDLVIKHVQEVDLFECVYNAMPLAACFDRADTSVHVAAVCWKSKHVMATMIEDQRFLLVDTKDRETAGSSTARLLFERGNPGKQVLEYVLTTCPHLVLCVDQDGDTLLHTAVGSGDSELVATVLLFMVHDRSMMHARRNRNGLLALEVCFTRSDIKNEVVEEMVLDLKDAMETVYKSLILRSQPHIDCGVRFRNAAESWLLDRKTADGYEKSLAEVGGLVSEFQHEKGTIYMTLQTVDEAKKSFVDAMLIVAREAWSPDSGGSDVVYLCPVKARELVATLVRTPFGIASTPDERRFAGFCAGYCLHAFRPEMRSENGVTLMHIAAAARADINIVDLLERAYVGSNIYCADDWGNTPGHYLLICPARSNVLSRSMTSPAPVEVFGVQPELPPMHCLMDSIETEGLDRPQSNVIARMVCSDPTQARAVNTSQFTMLALAARARISLEDFKLIYKANKDAVRFQGDAMKMTPLHHCVCSFDLEVLAVRAKTTLVEGRLSNTLSNNSFRAAATTFLLEVYPEAAHLCDGKGRTPLHLASKTCAPLGLVEMLLRHSKTGRRKNPRTGAVSWESNVLDLKDASGNTPVSYALMQKRRIFEQQDDLVLAMLHDGVCMRFRNQQGLSLYHLVLLHGYVGRDSIANEAEWSVATKLNVERSEQQMFLPGAVCHMANENVAGFLEHGPDGVHDAVRHAFETCALAIGTTHLNKYLKTLDVIVYTILVKYVDAHKLEPLRVHEVCSRMLGRVAAVKECVAAFYAAYPLEDRYIREVRTIELRLEVVRVTIEGRRDFIGKQQAAELAADRMQQALLKTLDDEAQAAQATAAQATARNRKHRQSRKARATRDGAEAGAEAGAAGPRPPLVSPGAEAGAAGPRPPLVSPAALAPPAAPSVCGPLDFGLRLRELEEENTRLVAENSLARCDVCSICFGEHGPLDHAIAPCGHVFCHTDAVLSLASGFCFSCRAPAKTTMRLYGL